MAQTKEQNKAPEKIQLSNEEIANTGNQDADRNGWVWSQNRGKREGYISEIKENAQRVNNDMKETGTQINGLYQKEEISIQPE